MAKKVTRDRAASAGRVDYRAGRKLVGGFFDPAVRKQLHQMALDREPKSTLQALLSEALNDLFKKYKKAPIA